MGAERELTRAAVERALGEFHRIGRSEFLGKYGFGKAREYFIRSATGELCDSKAIAGAAYGYQFPERGPLRPEAFSGGEETVASHFRSLDFEVVVTGRDWSTAEVHRIVRDYFDMLQLESQQLPYNKAEHNRALREELRTRSKGSIERKHQNISAVLTSLGFRHIDGYKPLANTQSILEEEVRRHIEADAMNVARMLLRVEEPPSGEWASESFTNALTTAPANAPIRPQVTRARIPRRINFARVDEANRSIGRLGERWVLEYERRRLTAAGRADLASQVVWVADVEGDGAGYDIRSKDLSGADLHIEVKTTSGTKVTPFVLTDCELSCSREYGERFQIYRVFNFATRPKLFTISGPLDQHLTLEPSEFRARFRNADGD